MTSLTGLIGYPLTHSRSPDIHGYWLAHHGIDADYKLFTTQPARLRQTMLHMRRKPLLGLNITIPHKVTVTDHLDGVDALAEQIGAVNTVRVEGNRLIGTNTDAYGFITNLRAGLTGSVAGDLSPHLDHAVILGAGGATRAAIVALKQAGARRITVTNRTFEAAATLAERFGIQAAHWDSREQVLHDATLLINTTSLGMEGQPPLVLDIARLPESAVVHDIVYAPRVTPLLAAAQARGLRTVDGLGMLLYQAQAAFEHWHGVRPEVSTELRTQIG